MLHPLTFAEYEEAAARTRLYSAHDMPLYPFLKLAGEAGEVARTVGAHVGEHGHDLLSDDELDELTIECGDVLWYLAAIARDFDLSLEGLARYPAPPTGSTLTEYANAVRAQRPSMQTLLVRLTLRLADAAGSVNETLGKFMRDDAWRPGAPLDAVQQATLATKCRLVMEVLTLLADETGAGLEGVARRNIEKLVSRQERGVLQGSGDNR